MINMVNVVSQALAYQLFPANPVIKGTGDIAQLLPVISHASILRVFFIECIHTYHTTRG